MKLYTVGGCVRDEILGTPSNDIDFSVVLSDEDLIINSTIISDDHDPFVVMSNELQDLGFKIFLETPEFLTIRAQFPKNHEHSGLTADFVLARKEGEYTDGRRPDKVTPGTLEDDLARRDFTINSMAKDSEGNLIDPFNGMADIENRVIRTVGDPQDRFREDALRAVRALRFSVTKEFNIHYATKFAMQSANVLDLVASDRISDDRIRVELSKMFRFDTTASLFKLNEFPLLTQAMFAGSVSLDATMKTKGRG